MVLIRTTTDYGRRAQPNRKAKGGRRPRKNPPAKKTSKKTSQPAGTTRPGLSLPFDYPPSDDERLVALSQIHPKLANAVGMNATMPPHFRFDVTAPYVEYKCGDDYSEDKTFPEREITNPKELTDASGDGKGRRWMPYMPREYTCVPCSLFQSQHSQVVST